MIYKQKWNQLTLMEVKIQPINSNRIQLVKLILTLRLIQIDNLLYKIKIYTKTYWIFWRTILLNPQISSKNNFSKSKNLLTQFCNNNRIWIQTRQIFPFFLSNINKMMINLPKLCKVLYNLPKISLLNKRIFKILTLFQSQIEILTNFKMNEYQLEMTLTKDRKNYSLIKIVNFSLISEIKFLGLARKKSMIQKVWVEMKIVFLHYQKTSTNFFLKILMKIKVRSQRMLKLKEKNVISSIDRPLLYCKLTKCAMLDLHTIQCTWTLEENWLCLRKVCLTKVLIILTGTIFYESLTS